ncbi:transposase [Methanosarcina sp. 1.H.A.2.2]|uniref:transposase n=1 Tax=Methanosarcina sp. 1.H.A.2.2 TaxID=1483601 RepID=UPI0006228111|nr:transposase [Methanosarcina sp. 1.H.A.2.2]KKH45967.1 hypothetical protein EO93_06905 [Methanosarcina sp. 1.H.A.2.2]
MRKRTKDATEKDSSKKVEDEKNVPPAKVNDESIEYEKFTSIDPATVLEKPSSRWSKPKKNGSLESRLKRRTTAARKIRGKIIAKEKRVMQLQDGSWLVKGDSGKKYPVKFAESSGYTCTCPDFVEKLKICKHIHAVQTYSSGEPLPDKKELDKELKTLQKQNHKTYTQNWTKYNEAQRNEKPEFLKILREVCSVLKELEANKLDKGKERGRPQVPLDIMIFSMVHKVYSMLSCRRFESETKLLFGDLEEQDLPSYNTILAYMQKEELTPILTNLIELVSTPLVEIERVFAMDSSGFSTGVYESWYSEKYGAHKSKRKWLKAHINIGVKSNIITAVKITSSDVSDTVLFEELFTNTAKNFKIEEQTADGAYLSRKNLDIVSQAGGIPYIPFDSCATRRADTSLTWTRMYDLFHEKREEFLKHLQARNNVESAFNMIKSKFGERLKSRKMTSQINEILCKVLCHNIVVLIHELHEMGISIDQLFDGKAITRAIPVVNRKNLVVKFSPPESMCG